MKKLTEDELKVALDSHKKYLLGEKGGERFNGASLNLHSADLYGADLRSANLGGADLYCADLRSADLRTADLGGADLRSADLGGANLRNADLGVKTELAKKLRLIGACMGASLWVDKQEDQSDPQKLFEKAEPSWQKWLGQALGGEPTMQRLDFVVDYITKGIA